MAELSLMEVDYWQKTLGLLPVPLFPKIDAGSQYVLLNGTRGNFCLDLESSEIVQDGRNRAWSSNVGHYVAVGRDKIEVQRWDQVRTVERYGYQSVYDQLEEFHSYLEKDIPRQGVSVVSHVIGVFRRLRAKLGPSFDGKQSLKALLVLLACSAAKSERRGLATDEWGLGQDAMDLALTVHEADWAALQEELRSGRPSEELVPNLELVLQHSSGQLFQEAHYEALFVPQQSFQGFVPSSVRVTQRYTGTGVHFTPPALARTLVEEALFSLGTLPKELVVFDPACGSGEFLREVVRQLDLRKYSGKLKLIGWDLSESASDMSRFVLSWEKRHSQMAIEFKVKCTDSLLADWPKNVDIILMNPPFVSWEELKADQKAFVTKILGQLSRPRPDLSHAFLLKASTCIKKGGVLGTILPASSLDSVSARNLRHQLSQEMSPKLIARLGSHLLFSGVMIDAALYLAKKEVNDQPTIAFWADYRSSSNSGGLRSLRRMWSLGGLSALPMVGDGFSIYENQNLGHDVNSWAPRPYRPWILLNSLRYLPKVSDIFDVRQGIRTGKIKAFTLDKPMWASLPDEERGYFRPAVVNQSIIEGRLRDDVYVFYPYGDQRIENEDELENRLQTFYANNLLPHKTKLELRPGINKKRWWELTRHRAWQIEPSPKLVSTYFGDAGSFAWDKSGDFVVVQGFAWIPKKRRTPNDWTFASYSAVLNSRLFSDLLSATSNNVSGGQWNLSKKFVDEIPLPDLFDKEVNSMILVKLSEIGQRLSSGVEQNTEELNALVRNLYGVTAE